jgi:hypothetical protein
MLIPWQRLYQSARHILPVEILQLHGSFFNTLAFEMVLHIDVLGAGVIFGIVSQV